MSRLLRVRLDRLRVTHEPDADEPELIETASMTVHEQDRPIIFDADGYAVYRAIGFEPTEPDGE